MNQNCFPSSTIYLAILLSLNAISASARIDLPQESFPLGRPGLVETRTVKELRPGLTHIRVERGTWGADGPPKFSLITQVAQPDPELFRPLREVLEKIGLSIQEHRYKKSEAYASYYILSAGEFDSIEEARQVGRNAPDTVHPSNIAYWSAWQDGPYILTIIVIDPKQYHGKIVSEWSRRAWRSSPLELARQYNAVVAINSCFFEYSRDDIGGIPSGISIVQGEWHHEHWPEGTLAGQRSIISIDDNEEGLQTLSIGESAPPLPEFKWAAGKTIQLEGIDRMPKESELVVMRPTVAVTSNLSHGFPKEVLALQIGKDGYLAKGVIPDGGLVVMATGNKQTVLEEAMASNLPVELDLRIPGKPRLSALWTPQVFIREGVPLSGSWARPPKPSLGRRMAQSLIGSDDEGRIYLISFDGVPYWRPTDNRPMGANLDELWDVIQFLGLKNAASLDSGGGSSSMVIEGKVVDSPHLETYSEDRKVGEAILVIDD